MSLNPRLYWSSGSVQLVFEQNVSAVSLMIASDAMQPDLMEEVTLIDADGSMIRNALIHMSTDSPKTLNIPSEIPFRSIILANPGRMAPDETDESKNNWMFSELRYTADSKLK